MGAEFPTVAATVGDVVDALGSAAAKAPTLDNPDGPTLVEHSLQCAALLGLAYPEDLELQVAGLCHDVGHVVAPGAPEGHDAVGARFVALVFGPRVASLVRLHVAAKRYLVTIDPGYRERLSRVSLRALTRQGDAMGTRELSAFVAEPLWREAVALRRADEMAQTPGLRIGPLADWTGVMDEVSRRFGLHTAVQ
jgi:predicted HD phosphohydrolase